MRFFFFSLLLNLPRGLVHGLVGRLLGLLLVLVVQLGLAVDAGADHGDEHTGTVEEVNGDVEEEDAEGDGQALLEVAANGHGQSTGQLVGVERGDVEEERKETVAGQRRDSGGDGDVARAHEADEAADLAGGGSTCQRLESSQGRHAHQELDGGQSKGSSHESVGHDGLDCSQNNTKDGQEETGVGEAHLTGGGHSSADDERHQGEVGHGAVGAAVPDAENEDGEDGAQHAHRLVEGDGDHGEGQVGDGNVGGEEGAEGDEGEVLAATQARELEVAKLHHGVGAHAGKGRVQEGQEPREMEHAEYELVVESQGEREEEVGPQPGKLDGAGNGVFVVEVLAFGGRLVAGAGLHIGVLHLCLALLLTLFGRQERNGLLGIATSHLWWFMRVMSGEKVYRRGGDVHTA
jgi:hypothetical protein